MSSSLIACLVTFSRKSVNFKLLLTPQGGTGIAITKKIIESFLFEENKVSNVESCTETSMIEVKLSALQR